MTIEPNLTYKRDVCLGNGWQKILILDVATQSADLIPVGGEFQKLVEETEEELKHIEVLDIGIYSKSPSGGATSKTVYIF